MLTDAAGEDQRVDAAEDRGHGADLAAQSKDVVVDGLRRLRRIRGQERAHVMREAGQALEPAFFVKQRRDLLARHPLVEEIEKDAGVELAGPGAHRHPVQRREPHGGPDRPPALRGAERGAVAQMGDDDAALREVRVIGAEFSRDVVIAQPVKPVSPHALVIEPARQGEGVVDPGVTAMKGRVETGDLHRAGKGRAGGSDGGEVMGLVQRRERVQRGKLRDQRIADDARPVDIRPAMHHAVAHPGNLLPRQMRAQRLHQRGKTCPMIGGANPCDGPAAFRLDHQARGGAQPVDLAAQHLFGLCRRPVKAELDRTGPCVQRQDQAHRAMLAP